jgi:iron complex transport system ATP-binding protein
MATVPQNPAVPPGMAVRDYVLLGRTPYIRTLGRESTADLAAVDAVLDRLDLTRLAHRRLETLSGGERQRAFLARALAQGATLLLLDEPTAALDIGHQQEVLDLVDELRRGSGITVLACMHDLSVAGEYADRLVLLVAVRVVAGDHGPLVVPVRAVNG